MKKVLIICLSDLEYDPRVRRQIDFLKNKYLITTLGLRSPQVENVNFYSIKYSTFNENKNPFILINKVFKLIVQKKYEEVFWKSIDINEEKILELYDKRFDVIIANDISAMPIAMRIKNEDTKVIFDAHEYYAEWYNDNWKWRTFIKKMIVYLCNKYIPMADEMLCTSESMAEEYKKDYNFNPVVITNAPTYEKLSVSNVISEKIRIIHHGGFKASRHIDILVDMMKYLDERFYLDLVVFMPSSDKNYVAKIKEKASKYKRINFIPPVPMPEISKSFNSYDIGIHTLLPVNLNHKITIPNKFFEYVQSRLMIVTPGKTEMARLVNEYECGITLDDFNAKSVAEILNSLTTKDIMKYKENSNKNARQLSNIYNQKVLLKTISRIIDK